MMTRRALLTSSIASLALPHLALAQTRPDAADLIEAARKLAANPYAPGKVDLLPPFDQVDYDSFRGIRPRRGAAAGLPLGDAFRADLLPPGWLFHDPVQVTLPGHDTTFSASLFDLDPAFFPPAPPLQDYGSMGFSGLRLLHRLNVPDRWDEVLVLQGASYFRALARDTVYGLSARALSLGTGGAAPEEFPVATEIHVLGVDDRLSLGCLIDSPRAAAALLMTLDPGEVTRMTCSLHLFVRESVADAGIAPLTSMFQHSALGPARIDDFRPAVHDSDVLVIDNGSGERLWRPLSNPAQVQMSAFMDQAPRGFGLVQTPTAFDAFRDGEGAYHRRPSAWVRPRGDWGRGAVMLLEIPTDDEFADNIVAFWRPEAPLEPGIDHQFDYDLDWMAPGLTTLPGARFPVYPVISASGVEPNDKLGRLFVLDLTATGDISPEGIVATLTASDGVQVDGVALYALQDKHDLWRLSFLLLPEDDAPAAELRLTLHDTDGKAVAPVWLFRWTRRRDGGV